MRPLDEGLDELDTGGDEFSFAILCILQSCAANLTASIILLQMFGVVKEDVVVAKMRYMEGRFALTFAAQQGRKANAGKGLEDAPPSTNHWSFLATNSRALLKRCLSFSLIPPHSDLSLISEAS